MHAIVSIHDVMPHTLDRVSELLQRMSHLSSRHITLLVVPGLDWTAAELDVLVGFEHAGYRLAGHGWHHRTTSVRTMYHRIHAGLLSRQAAEHLSLESAHILELIRNCHAWFANKGLALPDLYVPPAWAMGKVSRQQLGQTPFRYFETTAGLYDSHTRRRALLPLAGFEADTRLRATSLRCWNAANCRLGSARRPLRLSIHPDDHRLLLQDSLEQYLSRISATVDYHAVV